MSRTKVFFHDTGVTLQYDWSRYLDAIPAATKIREQEYNIADFLTMQEYVKADETRLYVDNLTKAFEKKGEGDVAEEIKKDIERNSKARDLYELYEAQRYALAKAYEEQTM